MYKSNTHHSPSKHQNSSLRIGPRRDRECWTVNYSERANTHNPEFAINHLPHKAATVIMPDGTNCPTAKVSHEPVIRLISRQCGPYISEISTTEPFWKLEFIHGAASQHISNLPCTIYTPLQICWVTEIVEPDDRVHPNIVRSQLEWTCRDVQKKS